MDQFIHASFHPSIHLFPLYLIGPYPAVLQLLLGANISIVFAKAYY